MLKALPEIIDRITARLRALSLEEIQKNFTIECDHCGHRLDIREYDRLADRLMCYCPNCKTTQHHSFKIVSD